MPAGNLLQTAGKYRSDFTGRCRSEKYGYRKEHSGPEGRSVPICPQPGQQSNPHLACPRRQSRRICGLPICPRSGRLYARRTHLRYGLTAGDVSLRTHALCTHLRMASERKNRAPHRPKYLDSHRNNPCRNAKSTRNTGSEPHRNISSEHAKRIAAPITNQTEAPRIIIPKSTYNAKDAYRFRFSKHLNTRPKRNRLDREFEDYLSPSPTKKRTTNSDRAASMPKERSENRKRPCNASSPIPARKPHTYFGSGGEHNGHRSKNHLNRLAMFGEAPLSDKKAHPVSGMRSAYTA